jgi:hypothetical protein
MYARPKRCSFNAYAFLNSRPQHRSFCDVFERNEKGRALYAKSSSLGAQYDGDVVEGGFAGATGLVAVITRCPILLLICRTFHSRSPV